MCERGAERGDICIHIADSCCTETLTMYKAVILQLNFVFFNGIERTSPARTQESHHLSLGAWLSHFLVFWSPTRCLRFMSCVV